MKVRYKKLGTICRNHEIYLLEVPFGKLKTRVKIYYKHGLHHLELKLLPVISTNFDGNFQSSVLKVISPSMMSKWMWPSGLRCQTSNQMMIGSSPADTKICFRISL